MEQKDAHGTDWNLDTCTCGYWVKGKWSGKEKHDREAGCPNKIYDNTPNPIGLMNALRTLSVNRKVN